MNRGSISLTPTQAPRLGGFNEAPIHESGKYSARQRQSISRMSFNEAPIHESGKCPDHRPKC